MRIRVELLLAVLGALGAAACATEPQRSAEAISIPYDPNDYDPDDLQAEADAHCSAYGLRAFFDDETIDESSVRWRYRHYSCL